MNMKLSKNKLVGALLRIAVVIALLVLVDLCFGGASAWLYHRSKYGIFHRQQYVLNESKDDIIILGSSRASHHYVPSILSDSLGMSCYNAGSDGMCVYYHYAVLAAMIERGHCPKIVIYDAMDYDVKEHPGPTFTLEAALDRLAPHYGEYSCVDSVFMLKGWKEKMKLLSLSYRYNSKLVQSIKCNYMPQSEDGGYEKLEGRLQPNDDFIDFGNKNYTIDDNKLEYLNKIIKIAKENQIWICFIMSPQYSKESSNAIEKIKEIAQYNNILCLDYSNDDYFMSGDFFSDTMHLNDKGAHAWSSFIAYQIKNNSGI